MNQNASDTNKGDGLRYATRNSYQSGIHTGFVGASLWCTKGLCYRPLMAGNKLLLDLMATRFPGVTIIALSLLLPSMNASALPPFNVDVPNGNRTEQNIGDVIGRACPAGLDEIPGGGLVSNGLNDAQFQDRCNAIVGDGTIEGQNVTLNDDGKNGVAQASPLQVAEQGTQATRISGGQVTVITALITQRLAQLRAGLPGVGVAGVQVAVDGPGVPNDELGRYENSEITGGAAGGDVPSVFDRLGVFVNATYNWGDVDESFQQTKEFDFDNWGITSGIDYRFTDNFILGGAFNYFKTDADFDNSAGDAESDAYSGSLFATYYFSDQFYVDAIGTYGSIDYDLERRIRYSIPGNALTNNQNEFVNTTAEGDPDGDIRSFYLGVGYNFFWNEFTVTPYVGAEYTKLEVDAYNEKGGAGWAVRTFHQDPTSRRTTVGVQSSKVISTHWGVFVPQLRGEWHHEFDDEDRNIGMRFLGDGTFTQFSTFVGGRDRDYFNVGAEVSAQFPRGIAAFVSYSALLGYDDITSNAVVGGVRYEF